MASRTHGTVDLLDTICFVRWSTRPDPSGIQQTLDWVVAARRSAGQQLILVSIVPIGAELPGREAREALHRTARVADRLCEAQYAVFQGSSIRARIVRGFLVAVGLAMRSTVEIVPDVETALQRVGTRLGIVPAVLITKAHALGILA